MVQKAHGAQRIEEVNKFDSAAPAAKVNKFDSAAPAAKINKFDSAASAAEKIRRTETAIGGVVKWLSWESPKFPF